MTIKDKNRKGRLADLRGGKDSSQRKADGMTYASKHILDPIKFVLQEGSFQEYAYAAMEIGEQI